MAMAVASGGGGGRRRGRRGGKSKPMSEINVTPMVDVMLVLLIIFMVAAPLMTVGVPIDLPKTQARQLNTEQKPVTVSVNPEGLIYVGEAQVPLEGVVEAVTAASPNGIEDRVYVRGDGTASYGAVMQVMGALSGAGFTKIGLLTDQAEKQP
ncbi:MAG: protein TolR [Devosia sp.]|uniref:protein TolR n=1 Tax=Devosia sp. TaxID=1871048 RepID=UPI001A647066|nr:protein TolR [Devosia sp.]MBL8599690.1 protein TolR [Devosia sp.]